MTGRIDYTPEAEQQLHDLDEWITNSASADTAQRFVSAIMSHIEGILAFPHAGRTHDGVRPGMRTIAYKKRTLIAYAVEETTDDVVITIIGVFHGGQDWETALRDDPS